MRPLLFKQVTYDASIEPLSLFFHLQNAPIKQLKTSKKKKKKKGGDVRPHRGKPSVMQ
jgi:hypothetical protein